MFRKKNTELPHKNSYFPHIDGLRSLAILPVLFYHLNPSFCSGGFAGVDIFFVISGYLITHGILKNLQKSEFSVLDFYDRRIRRIIPIYSFVIFCVLIFAPLVYYPDLLFKLSAAASSSVFFLSNVYFFFNINYFTNDFLPSPVLNLWSLSVEEQFYMVLPLALFLCFKFARKYVLHFLIACFVVSIIAAEAVLIIGYRADAAFYMLPFRAWELLAGSLLAYLAPLKRGADYGFKGSVLGAVAIGALVFFYYNLTKNDAFPGLAALPFVLIAAVLIKFGDRGVAGFFLKSSPFVFVGKISYSLYLWHWPIITFWRYVSYDVLGAADYIAIGVLSILLSTLSWRFIETPVRAYSDWKRKYSFILFFLTSAIIISVCALYRFTDGGVKIFNLHPEAAAVACESRIRAPKSEASFVKLANGKELKLLKLGDQNAVPTLLLFGDSHAYMLASALGDALKNEGRAGYFIDVNCKLVADADYYVNGIVLRTAADFDAYLEWIVSQKEIRDVLLVNRWASAYPGNGYALSESFKNTLKSANKSADPKSVFENGVEKTCATLSAAGKRVWLLGAMPELLYNAPEFERRSRIIEYRGGDIAMNLGQYERRNAVNIALFRRLEAEGKARIIPAQLCLLNGSSFLYKSEASIYYIDDDHLSNAGAKPVVEAVLKSLNN